MTLKAVMSLAALAAAPVVLTRATSIGRIHSAESTALAPAPVALVLGARVWEDGRPSRFLRQRVEVGVQLYRRGLVGRLLMSGAGHNREGQDEPGCMARVAEEMGVPFHAIDIDPLGVDTNASMLRARSEHGLTEVIVCSQEFHLPRALWLARHAGLSAQGAYPPILVRKHTLAGYVREVPATAKAMLTVAHAWSQT